MPALDTVEIPDVFFCADTLRVYTRGKLLRFSYPEDTSCVHIDEVGARALKAFLEAFLRGEETVPV